MTHERGRGVTKRGVVRGALAGAFFSVVPASTTNSPEREWASVNFVIATRLELRQTFHARITWFAAYKNVVRGENSVVGAQPQIRPMLDLVSYLILDANKALKALERLDAALLRANGQRTNALLAAALNAKFKVDHASESIGGFMRELGRVGSPIRGFDRIARGIDVET